MNTMNYKGFNARVEFDDDDGIFVGHLAGINDVVGFHAETVADLRAAFHEAVDDYVETCAKIGKDPQKPFSGQLMVRVNPEVHARAALAAELRGVSLAKWTEGVLLKEVCLIDSLKESVPGAAADMRPSAFVGPKKRSSGAKPRPERRRS